MGRRCLTASLRAAVPCQTQAQPGPTAPLSVQQGCLVCLKDDREGGGAYVCFVCQAVAHSAVERAAMLRMSSGRTATVFAGSDRRTGHGDAAVTCDRVAPRTPRFGVPVLINPSTHARALVQIFTCGDSKNLEEAADPRKLACICWMYMLDPDSGA